MISLDGSKAFETPNNKGITPLHLAALKGAHLVLKVLLDCSANPVPLDEELGWTPLHFAVCRKKVECTNILLSALSAEQVDIKSLKFQQTPLIVAARYGRY